jgi:hypothetical protein
MVLASALPSGAGSIMQTADHQTFLFDLCMVLRQVPPATLRDPGKRRLSGDELPEQIAAEMILEHLLRCRS